jgi:hypothetical protein
MTIELAGVIAIQVALAVRRSAAALFSSRPALAV